MLSDPASRAWAGRAFTYLTRNKQHGNQVRKVARELGVNAELQLSEHYYRRHLRRKKASSGT